MRHGKKFNHLGRKAPHRKAMLSNMATSLIINKRITTTVAKAKALRKYVEPLLTKSKEDTTHSRRVVFSYLQDKDTIKELFGAVAGKIAERPGGYTRIIKTGNRLGDNAEMCIIELVDYNEHLVKEPKKKTTRRSRRGGSAKADTPKAGASADASAPKEEAKAEEPKAEAPVDEVKADASAEEATADKEVKAEEPKEPASAEAPADEETKAEETPKEEAKAEEPKESASAGATADKEAKAESNDESASTEASTDEEEKKD